MVRDHLGRHLPISRPTPRASSPSPRASRWYEARPFEKPQIPLPSARRPATSTPRTSPRAKTSIVPHVRPLTDALDAAASTDSELYFLKLNGNSKALFTDRLRRASPSAVALDGNTTIAELDLSYNNIDDEGVAALADALRRNRALLRLDLRGNDVTARGVRWRTRSARRPAGAAAPPTSTYERKSHRRRRRRRARRYAPRQHHAPRPGRGELRRGRSRRRRGALGGERGQRRARVSRVGEPARADGAGGTRVARGEDVREQRRRRCARSSAGNGVWDATGWRRWWRTVCAPTRRSRCSTFDATRSTRRGGNTSRER